MASGGVWLVLLMGLKFVRLCCLMLTQISHQDNVEVGGMARSGLWWLGHNVQFGNTTFLKRQVCVAAQFLANHGWYVKRLNIWDRDTMYAGGGVGHGVDK